MVDLDEEDFGAPARARPGARRQQGGPGSGGSVAGRRRGRSGSGAGTRTGLPADIAPFLFLLASMAPLAGAVFRIIDLVGLDGLTATEAVGPRLQLLGSAVNPLTGLLVVAAVVVAVLMESSHARMVAGTAVAIATLLLVVSVAVTVAAVRDDKIFARANDAYIEVISYEVGSALVALGVIWLALRVLRSPRAA